MLFFFFFLNSNLVFFVDSLIMNRTTMKVMESQTTHKKPSLKRTVIAVKMATMVALVLMLLKRKGIRVLEWETVAVIAWIRIA